MMNEIFSRRSIRRFKTEDISEGTIIDIVEAGIAAPSAKNRQPWKVCLYKGKQKEELISELEKGIKEEESDEPILPGFSYGIADAKNTVRVMKEAPVLLVIINWNGNSPFKVLDAEGRFVEICDSLSIGAFIQNMLLKAEELGVGSLWIGNTCFAYDKLMEYIGEEGQLIGAVALGIADETPNVRPRKSIRDVLIVK